METIIQELRATLAKMDMAMGAIHEAIFWTDEIGNLQWCNETFADLAGKPRALLFGHRIVDILPLMQDGAPLDANMHPVAMTLADGMRHYGIYDYAGRGMQGRIEMQCFPLNEDKTHCCTVGTVLYLDGMVSMSFGSVQGVALAESANAIGIVAVDGSLSWVNSAWERSTGLSRNECCGKSLEQAVGCGQITGEMLASLRAGGVWSGEVDSHNATGARRVERVTLTPLFSRRGEILCAVVVKHDVTALRESQEAAYEQEARLHAILEQVVDAIITADEVGTIEAANPAALSMFGYSLTEMLGANVMMLAPPDVAPHHSAYMARYVSGGEPRIIGIDREVEARRKDGSLFPVDFSISEVRTGTRRLFTAIVRDISKRKFWEQELLQLNRSLQAKQASIDETLVSAAEVQRSFLPEHVRQSRGVDFSWIFIPCDRLGGDMLGALELGAHGRFLALYIIDVAGHGVPAALVGTALVQALQHGAENFAADGVTSPARVLHALERQFPHKRFGRHSTLFYGVLDTVSGTFVYSSAGHPLAFVVRADGKLERLDKGGTILGIGAPLGYEEGAAQLGRGDKIVLYTDGLVELENSRGDVYGEERLLPLLTGHAGCDADGMIKALHADIEAFADVAPTDDISVLVTGMPSGEEKTDAKP